MYTKIAIFVFKFFFLPLLQAKNKLSPSRPLIYFERRASKKRMPSQKVSLIQFYWVTSDSSQAKCKHL